MIRMRRNYVERAVMKEKDFMHEGIFKIPHEVLENRKFPNRSSSLTGAVDAAEHHKHIMGQYFQQGCVRCDKFIKQYEASGRRWK